MNPWQEFQNFLGGLGVLDEHIEEAASLARQALSPEISNAQYATELKGREFTEFRNGAIRIASKMGEMASDFDRGRQYMMLMNYLTEGEKDADL